jgi:hypothetical protein
MKEKIVTVALIASAALPSFITPRASAVYLGLQVVKQQVMLQNGTVMNRFRVYANCSDPDDYLTAFGGSPTLGNLVLQSVNSDGSGVGSVFFNPPGGGPLAPTLAAIAQNPDVEHDTFATFGVTIADQAPPPGNQTGLSPGFGGFASVTQINTNNAGCFTPGPVEQGRAGFLGDGDPLLRVLLMQLTVSSTSQVRGTVAISGVNNIPLAGGQAFTVPNQTFNSIPAPASGLALMLGIVGCTARRRRVAERTNSQWRNCW